jgi:hypothetical protein
LNGVFILNKGALDTDEPPIFPLVYPLILVSWLSSFLSNIIGIVVRTDLPTSTLFSSSHMDGNAYLLETTQIGRIARPTVAPIVDSFQTLFLILFPLLNKNHNLAYSQLKATVPRFAYYRRLDDQAFDLRMRLFWPFWPNILSHAGDM